MSSTINADTTNGVVVTSDTSGEIELQSNGVTKAKVTANGLQDASGSAIIPQAGKNLIINGDMKIAQRGTSFNSQTSSAYHLDRWKINSFNILSGVYQIDQDTDAPSGFSNSLKLSCTTANGTQDANDIFYLEQQIEGLNTSHLKYFVVSPDTVTLSFWIKTNLSGTYSVALKLSDNGSVQNNTATRVYNTTYTVNSANTWERKTVTIQLDSAVGDVQVIDNRFAMATTFWFGAGTSRDGATTNTWINNGNAATLSNNLNILGNTSNYINITGVQLETGTTATDFENLQYGQQLALCQRYFQIFSHAWVGVSAGAGYFYSALGTFNTAMRTTPTATRTGGTSSTRYPSSNWAVYTVTPQRMLSLVSAVSAGGNEGWTASGILEAEL